jgi:hypothetical protein
MTKADLLMAKDGALGEDGEWDCLGFWKKEGQDHHLEFKWLINPLMSMSFVFSIKHKDIARFNHRHRTI